MNKISTEELKKLLVKARKNDDSAFAQLCRIYEGMIRKSVSAFESRIDMPSEDLRQEALIAFSRAVNTYDLEKKEVTFGLFAKICVRNALISQERKSNSRKRRSVSTAELSEADDGSSDIKELLTSEGEKTRLIKERLTDFERSVLAAFVEGKSYAEIAESLGVDKKKVDNTLYRLRKKLKKAEII